MAQFARPDADLSVGAWKTQADGTSNLYQTIDESVASDTDYIKSEDAPASSPYVASLSAVDDPQSATGHTVRYRYAKSAAGGAQVNLTVQLRQGYVNEGTPGTLIASKALTNIADGFADDSFTLSSGEANAISDYTDLSLRFLANQV